MQTKHIFCSFNLIINASLHLGMYLDTEINGYKNFIFLLHIHYADVHTLQQYMSFFCAAVCQIYKGKKNGNL